MRRPTAPNLLALLGAFVAVAVGLGLISAGLMIPLAGASGQAAKATVQGFNDLDDEFTANPLAQASKIYSADNKQLAKPYESNREIVPLQKISENMRMAQMAIEDDRFYEHGGIDLRGTSRAFFSNLGGNSTQGGSSITQQYVKIMLQDQALRRGDQAGAAAATEASYSRKLQELKYAMNIEKTKTKGQILSAYLNLVYYGDQTYGVEAASRHFFSKSASKLNLAESATLAGVVQSPGVLNIAQTDDEQVMEAVQERRDLVLDRMLTLQWITQEEHDEAVAKDVPDYVKLRSNEGGTCTGAVDPYFCNYVIAYLKTRPELGDNPDERMQAINTGGLRIKTTLRRDWQNDLEDALKREVPAGEPDVGAAGAMIEPGTGKVRAIAQTSEFRTGQKRATTRYSEQSWSVPTEYGGTNGQAIGSTAKPFALVAALSGGMPMGASVNAPPASFARPAVFQYSQFDEKCSGVNWQVRNAGDSTGTGVMSLAQATKGSVNTAFAQLATEIGSCNIAKYMDKMGLRTGDGEKYGLLPDGKGGLYKDQYAISNLVLGSDSSTPLQLASAYATLAADGKYCAPNPIEKITIGNSKKEIKLDHKGECRQAIDKDVARGVTQLMQGALQPGGTAGPQSALADGRVAAGKTGTTDSSTESWFAGFTPQLSTAIWVGTPQSQKAMRDITIGGTYRRQVFGGTIAAPIWKEAMDAASQGMDKKWFSKPGAKVINGDLTAIPSVTGLPLDEARKQIEDAGFRVVSGGQAESTAAEGTAAYTSPSGQALTGIAITLYTSNGVAPANPEPQNEPAPAPTQAAPTEPASAPPSRSPASPRGAPAPSTAAGSPSPSGTQALTQGEGDDEDDD